MMKIWRLVSGILSIASFSIVMYQSVITAFINGWNNNHKDTSDVGGVLFAYGLLASGILSTALWKDKSKGGGISLTVIYTLTALIGFTNLGTFEDLIIWSSWAVICASTAGYGIYSKFKEDEELEIYEAVLAASDVPHCPNCHAVVDVNSTFCGSCGQKIPKQSFCKNCGNSVEPEALFCPKCGTKQHY